MLKKKSQLTVDFCSEKHQERTSELGLLSKDMIEKHITPHLNKRERGAKPKIPVYQIVMLILYCLESGGKWRQLPVTGVGVSVGKRSIIISENGVRMVLGEQIGYI